MENSLTYTIFLSTLSLRRATGIHAQVLPHGAISIHALLAESDLHVHVNKADVKWISIHALLAESDAANTPFCGIARRQFLSTLSLRRATVKCHKKQFLFCS